MYFMNRYPSCQNRIFCHIIGKAVAKLFYLTSLTNRKSGNQLWQLGPVQEIYIFLRGHVSFVFYEQIQSFKTEFSVIILVNLRPLPAKLFCLTNEKE